MLRQGVKSSGAYKNISIVNAAGKQASKGPVCRQFDFMPSFEGCGAYGEGK